MTNRSILCYRCQGAGEITNIISERIKRCPTCRGHGTVDVQCTVARPRLRIEEATPMASELLDQAGKAVEL